MARLVCKQCQRTASGYDFYYHEVGNPDFMISADNMIAYRSLLKDPWDADEWREWFAIQVPGEPRVPSPRKWGDGIYNGRTLDAQRTHAAHMHERAAWGQLPTHLTKEEAESLAAFIKENYPAFQAEVDEYTSTFGDLRYEVYAWPAARQRGLDYALFPVSDSGCRYFYDCTLPELVQQTLSKFK